RCPVLAPLPRKRATVLDVLRRSTSWSFLQPVIVLSASAGALVAAVAFLPASTGLGANLIAAASIATVIALASSLTQPLAGRTLGAAELGRELGDAGAPTLVGLVSSSAGLGPGLVALGVALLGATAAALAPARRSSARSDG